MASYDQPGYVNRYPGGEAPAGTGAPGSMPTGIPDTTALPDTSGTTGNSAWVTVPGASLANGDRVTVSPLDTLVGRQADLYSGSDADPMNGNPGDGPNGQGYTGAGDGNVVTPHHPSSMNVPDLASQIEAARRPS